MHNPKNTDDTRSQKRQGRILLQSLYAGITLWQTPWFQTSGFQNCEKMHFCCFQPPIFYGSFKNLIHLGSGQPSGSVLVFVWDSHWWVLSRLLQGSDDINIWLHSKVLAEATIQDGPLCSGLHGLCTWQRCTGTAVLPGGNICKQSVSENLDQSHPSLRRVWLWSIHERKTLVFRKQKETKWKVDKGGGNPSV